jgi:hypothetical protein
MHSVILRQGAKDGAFLWEQPVAMRIDIGGIRFLRRQSVEWKEK